MKLINWTPNINVNNVFDELDFFMNSFNSKNNSNNTTIRDCETFYKIILEMPGINKKDISLTINNDVINIKADNNINVSNHKNDTINYSYDKSYYLPEDVNKEEINANYKNGLLEIELTKLKSVTHELKKIKIS